MRQQMDPIALICVTVLYTFAIRDDFFAFGVSLLPISVDQLEMSDVTLKCLNEGLISVKWTRNTLQSSIELNSGTCKTYPGSFLTENPNLYSYRCTENEFTVTLKNISRFNDNDLWSCGVYNGNVFIDSNRVTIRVKVPLTTVTISQDNNRVTEKENTSISLQCTTSVCRPQPKFQWYKDKTQMTDRDEILLPETPNDDVPGSPIQSYINTNSIKLTRELNGWHVYCAADNQNGSYVLSNKILLNVTYPPDGPPSISNLTNKGEFRVLQNDIVRLECLVKGGNPLPRLEWNKFNESPQQINGDIVTKATSWQTTGQDPVDLTCQSFPTHRNDYVHITINILYPPDKPDISIEVSSGIYKNVDNTISVIEGRTFKLNCSAKSNPPVSLFKWNDFTTDLGNVYTARSVRGATTISCYVSNDMRFSNSRASMTGYNFTSLDVDILYPPTVNKLPNRTVVEGDDVIYRCNFEPGNPSFTNVTWSWNGTTWNDRLLTISNVTMNHEGEYKCDVRNVMVSSDGTKEFGISSGEFYLSVTSYKNDDYSTPSSNVNNVNNVNVVAASAAGTAAGVVFLAVLIIIVMVYRRRKRMLYQKKDISVQYYNVCNSKDGENKISTEDDSLHIYDGLQNTGYEQQYETISPTVLKVEQGHHIAYENLQLTRTSEGLLHGQSSSTVQTASMATNDKTD